MENIELSFASGSNKALLDKGGTLVTRKRDASAWRLHFSFPRANRGPVEAGQKPEDHPDRMCLRKRTILGETLPFAPDGSVSAHTWSGLIPIQVSVAAEKGVICKE